MLQPSDRIVYVCGAFDLFHVGHLAFLEKVPASLLFLALSQVPGPDLDGGYVPGGGYPRRRGREPLQGPQPPHHELKRARPLRPLLQGPPSPAPSPSPSSIPALPVPPVRVGGGDRGAGGGDGGPPRPLQGHQGLPGLLRRPEPGLSLPSP